MIDSVPYRVLARKYRPQNFSELIGQDALVRTLQNAISTGRIAHAYMLTGVRGVGKTTTARIIAKALNYTGADGKAGPTTGPTDDCALSRAIAEDRHPDVIEMDAASNTGIDDIRSILDGVRYAPSQARYKIYIIDEVHMLSKAAFNALLKTLEEPPPHVKFIFATTEIRKVPVTVLSRCQRFDLRRVDPETLQKHFSEICLKEKVEADPDALALIARAADGSVRDGLSLLDQAIALGNSMIDSKLVSDMLGLADQSRMVELFERCVMGQSDQALSVYADLRRLGAEASVTLQDLLSLTHTILKIKAAPQQAQILQQDMTGPALDRLKMLASSLSVPALNRIWQILLKGITEVSLAPDSHAAAEITLIRLAYTADLPDPAKLIRDYEAENTTFSSASQASSSPQGPATVMRVVQGGGGAAALQAVIPNEPVPVSAVAKQHQIQGPVNTLSDIVSLLETEGKMLLASHVFHAVHLVRLEEGRLDFRPGPTAPPKLSQDLARELQGLTGKRWIISVVNEAGQETLAQIKQSQQNEVMTQMIDHPLTQKIFQAFPGAKIVEITQK